MPSSSARARSRPPRRRRPPRRAGARRASTSGGAAPPAACGPPRSGGRPAGARRARRARRPGAEPSATRAARRARSRARASPARAAARRSPAGRARLGDAARPPRRGATIGARLAHEPLDLDVLGDLAQRGLAQRREVLDLEEVVQRRRHALGRIHLARAQPGDQRLRREVDQHDLVGAPRAPRRGSSRARARRSAVRPGR